MKTPYTEEKRAFAREMFKAGKPRGEILKAMIEKYKTGMSSKDLTRMKAEAGGKLPFKDIPQPGRKLTDAQVKLLTGAATKLPPNVTKVAERLRKLLHIHHIEYITIYKDRPTVRFARYQESEAAL
jgi:hypothetical protein